MSEKKIKQLTQMVKKNLSQKKLSSILNKDSMTSLKNTVLKKIAKQIKKRQNASGKTAEELDLEKIEYYEGASQTEIPVTDITDGIIQTVDGRHLGVIEILPINFDKLLPEEQDEIVDKYSSVFARGDYKIQIKIKSDTSNPKQMIDNIRENCLDKHDPKVQIVLEDYIRHIRNMSATSSVVKRYFYIYEYRSESGKQSGSWEDIKRTMSEIENSIIATMKSCGNLCVKPDDKDAFVLDMLYQHFNPVTKDIESVQDRYKRLRRDFARFNEVTGKNKEITFADLLAPKGLYFDNRNYVEMDGYFYGYLGIMGNSWPTRVESGWFNFFNLGPSVDVDIICRKLPHESTKLLIGGVQTVQQKQARAFARKGRDGAYQRFGSRHANNKEVYDKMSGGDPLYDVAIVLTFRASTPEILSDNMYCVKKAFKRHHIEVDESFLKCEDYFRMTMPLLFITKPFRELKHNILGSQLATTYCYTTYELNDPTGFVLGINQDDKSITAINNFNTQYFSNANGIILGSSGKGKTFLEQMIGRRSMFNGIRNFFIIPKKGHEYEKGCTAVNGTFIRLYPGSSDCINIMEIRPEEEIDLSKINTEDADVQKVSWRASKINNLLIWIQLLVGERTLTQKEYNLLNSGLVSIYEGYGITHQNESIFKNRVTGELKTMPTLQDLYEYCARIPDLEDIKETLEIFITGNCSNMNGQTNINLEKNYIVFDVNEDLIGPKLLPAFMYIAFDYVYSEVKTKSCSRDNVILDEVWKMLKSKMAAEQVHNLVKIIRGYGGSAIMATQDILDFLNAPEDFGKAVINNSEFRIVLGMEKDELKLVKESLGLTEKEFNTIHKYDRGYGMLIANGNKINLKLEASELERKTWTTDVNDRIAAS